MQNRLNYQHDCGGYLSFSYGSQVDEISHFKIVEAISCLQEAKSILI